MSFGGILVSPPGAAPLQVQATAEDIVQRILDILKRDIRFQGNIKAWYSSYQRSMVQPFVFVVAEDATFIGMGIGRVREEHTIKVHISRTSLERIDTKQLHKDVQDLRSALREHPRLDDLESVDLAECVGYKAMYGEGSSYFVSTAECTVKVKVHKIG